MQVLIVDSGRAAATAMRRTIERLGYRATMATSREKARSLHDSSSFQVVIISASVAHDEAAMLSRELRDCAGSHYTVIVRMTPAGDQAARLAALQDGADQTISTPVSFEELDAVLSAACRALQMREDLNVQSSELEAARADLEERNRELADAATYLTHANRRFAELFEGLPAGCYSWDREGRIHEWNRAAVDMFGFHAEEAFTRPTWELFQERSPKRQEENVRRERRILDSILAGEPLIGLEIERGRKDGSRIWVLCNVVPLRNSDGSIAGAISAHVDITARKQLEELQAEELQRATELNDKLDRQRTQLAQANVELAEKVVTDGLTGLKNHRHVHEIISANFSFARRVGIAFSVIMLDVDRFKQYNDAFGHPAGDEVLRKLALVLKDRTRAHDLVARYGGEEFIVLCPGTDAPGSLEAAERLRVAIEQETWPKRQITASFGVATFHAEIETASELVSFADRALYRSKESGRNCVTHWDEMHPITSEANAA